MEVESKRSKSAMRDDRLGGGAVFDDKSDDQAATKLMTDAVSEG
jgi:hypothetical protein